MVKSGSDAALMIQDIKETSSVFQASVTALLVFMMLGGFKTMILG
jgi:hypothetical protein